MKNNNINWLGEKSRFFLHFFPTSSRKVHATFELTVLVQIHWLIASIDLIAFNLLPFLFGNFTENFTKNLIFISHLKLHFKYLNIRQLLLPLKSHENAMISGKTLVNKVKGKQRTRDVYTSILMAKNEICYRLCAWILHVLNFIWTWARSLFMFSFYDLFRKLCDFLGIVSMKLVDSWKWPLYNMPTRVLFFFRCQFEFQGFLSLRP